MYQSYQAKDRLKFLALSQDYSVDACLIYGSRKLQHYRQIFYDCLTQSNIDFTIETPFDGFLEPVQSLLIQGKRIWFIVEYGGVRLSEFLHLACLFGSQKNIFLGSCGGLHPDLKTGDIIVPRYAYGNESTTRMYQRNLNNHHQADPLLSQKLTQLIQKTSSLKVIDGPVITCGAMLAETQEDIQQRSQEGYVGVEMESATVFAISNHFSIPSSALIYVADNIIKGQSVIDKSYQSQAKIRQNSIKFIINLALTISSDP